MSSSVISIKNSDVDNIISIPDNISYSEIISEVEEFIDSNLMEGIKKEISNIPICISLGYLRHIVSTATKTGFKKLDRCKTCNYESSCIGISEEYLKIHGTHEFIPINENRITTDNERCMLKILSHKNNISTTEILSLAKKFSICADCNAGNHVISAGEKLIRKKVIARNLSKDGYIWSLLE